jgi:signal transduction histidine kinase
VGPETNSIGAIAMSRRECVAVEDVTQSSFLAGASLDALFAAGVAAVQATPLLDRTGKFLGVLSTYYRAPHRFDADELRWLDLLARHAANIIDRRRTDEALASAHTDLEARVAERTKSLALVHEVTLAISDALTWDEALHRVVRQLCDSQGWQIGYVYLPDAKLAGSVMPIVSSFGDERFRPFHTVSVRRHEAGEASLAGRVFADGVPRVANGQQEIQALLSTRREVAREVGLQAALALPVRFGEEVIAVLELFSDRPHAPSHDVTTLMSDVSAQIGRVLERERSTAQVADLVWREQQELLHTLHDALGQTLLGLGMLGSGLSQHLSRGDVAGAAEAARQISEQAQQALNQVRRLARGLFPIDIEADRLADALRDLGATTQSLYKLPVHVEGDDHSSIRDGRVATQLYRIAQEAITNAVKHAQPTTIEVHLRSQAGRTTLRVSDDGVGIQNTAPTHNGVGLRIMHHRATSIGATLSVEPGTNGGTIVTCTVRDARPMTAQAGGSR